jgi:pyruvate dehydrogenase complex dehydrogenase (E1) component
MLFVSPIRGRAFVHEQAGVSRSVNAILETLSGKVAISRKQLFEKLIGDGAGEHAEARSLSLASDLRWLINEGYVIEFNDGSLDLPRGKAKQKQETVEAFAAANAWAVDATAHTRSWPLQLTWPEA